MLFQTATTCSAFTLSVHSLKSVTLNNTRVPPAFCTMHFRQYFTRFIHTLSQFQTKLNLNPFTLNSVYAFLKKRYTHKHTHTTHTHTTHTHNTHTQHTHTHPVDSSGRLIGPSQRPLPTRHAPDTGDEHHAQRDSNPGSQQSSASRPTP